MSSFKVIPDEEVKSIHLATLGILSEAGIVLEHPEAREMLSGAGCSIQDDRVYLPPELVEQSVDQCPRQVTIKGRGGQEVVLGDGSLHWHNLGGARDIYNPNTGACRGATVQDVRDSAMVLDALDQVTTITPLFTPRDVPGHMMSLAMYRHSLPFTTKPVQGPGVQTAREVDFTVKLAEVIGPVSEVLTMGISPVSPLTFPDDVVSSVLATALHGIPLGPLPCPTAGATSPISLAGAIAQQNAEVLATIVIAQLANPGLPIVYCGRLAMMEPRSGASVWGGVELGIASAATVQVAHLYDLPVNVYGLSTNAYVQDIQNGYERALNAVLPALAGADELSGVAEAGAGVLSSYAQMVSDNDIVASINRIVRGFEVNEDSLAVEVITSVMNGARNFLGQRHSVNYLRSGEMLYTRLGERRSWNEWERSGREGMAERAQAEADRILAEHEVPPLPDEHERELDEIMRSAENELVQES